MSGEDRCLASDNVKNMASNPFIVHPGSFRAEFLSCCVVKGSGWAGPLHLSVTPASMAVQFLATWLSCEGPWVEYEICWENFISLWNLGSGLNLN